MMTKVITSADQIDFTIADLPAMPLPGQVFMVDPKYFTVEYVINPHMANNIGKVDKEKARSEWNQIKTSFENVGIETHVVNGEKNLPDMVFCANQSLPFIDQNGDHHAIMSIMHSDHRKKEVPFIETWLRQKGYKIHHLDENKIDDFEGCGDAIWHTGRRLLWGGYGYRSSVDAYQTVSDEFGVPIIALKLVDEDFYHLDTCLCVLDEDTALIYPEAFTGEGRDLLNALFENVIHAPEKEAKKLFACNATCPDGKNVLIQKGCTETIAKLEEAGFTVHPLETEEYLKSGGSVFCMKQMIW